MTHALIGRAPPPRLAILVNDIESAIVSGDRARQSALVQRSADALTRRWSRLPLADKPAFDRLLSNLVEQVDEEARVAFVKQLMPLRRAPRETATRLARDTSAWVAVPLLEGCPSFDDAWLLDLLTHCGEAQLRAIARRACVSAALSNALIRTGYPSVAATLLANPGATLHPDQLAALAEKASVSKPLAVALAARRDLPPATRASLETLAQARACESLAADGMDDPAEGEALLDTVARAFETPPPAESAQRYAGTAAIIDRIAGSGPVSSLRIEQWIARRRIEDALAVLSRDAGLPIEVVLASYESAAPEPLAVIVVGLHYPWSLLKALLRSRCTEEPSLESLAGAHRIHAVLSPRTARRVCRYAAVRVGLGAFGRAATMDDSGDLPTDTRAANLKQGSLGHG